MSIAPEGDALASTLTLLLGCISTLVLVSVTRNLNTGSIVSWTIARAALAFWEVLIQLQMTPAAARGWDGQAFYPD